MHTPSSFPKVTSCEERLAMAMLNRAVADLQTDEGEARRSAVRWVASTLEDAPLSFAGCCESLGLSPDKVRRRLAARGLFPRK